MERRRATLMDFYAAGLAAYGGDHQTWGRAVERVASAEPGNAYYEWIIGRD
jgi:spermidine synthase